MAAADDSFNPKLLDSGPLFNDEKVEEKVANESVEVTSEFPGDVYEDSRAIDLGVDGKERPIGRSTTYQVRPAEKKPFLRFTQRLTSTLRHV
jgi:hypothetical protein